MKRNIHASSLMTEKVIVAKTSNSFTQVAKLFLNFHIHHLPVVDDNDQLIGVISSQDVLKAYTHIVPTLKNTDEDSLNAAIKIKNIMTPNPYVVDPTEKIGNIANMFVNSSIHSFPVLNKGKIVGIITTQDFINHFAVYG